ncbi:MAG: branched-chain amino acid ABC transporter permease, partial [Actinomycetota bacterium]|nr:branched-chain amino acid ABC transporter permease [Actinomycetota bacterium]
MSELLEALIRGLGTGSAYALLALGFVIIFKSTGVISFAQPALMLTGAVVASYVGPAIGFLVFTGLS